MPSTTCMRNHNERGIAMITTLLVLMLMSALLVGFTTVVMSDQRYRFIDRDRGQAFYAASAGVEKLTADLGNLFLQNVAPTAAQVTALTAAAKMPTISGITYTSPSAPSALPASQLTSYHCNAGGTKTPTPAGTSGYTIFYCKSNATGNPTISDDPLVITGTGAYAGMTALQTPYQIDVVAKTATGGEVHLSRTIQAVAIPVFQFGMFSDTDLSFFAGANYTFAGRIHTNGNLWLAEGGGAGNALTLLGRVTAVKDVVRQFLANGTAITTAPSWTQTVSLATGAAAPTGNRNLLATEGSVVGMPGSAAYGNWQTVSLGASPANYNGYLRNGPTGTAPGTGAKKLSLPLTAPGVTGCNPSPCTNVEIVRRPLAGEDPTGILYNERLFSKASIRILLSDTAADITSLPGIAAGAPVSLETNWNIAANLPLGYGPVSSTRPPPALSPGAVLMRNDVAAGAGGTFTPTVLTAASFRPTFTLATAPNSIITCTGKTPQVGPGPWQLTGCLGVTAAPVGTLLNTVSVVTPLGGAGGSPGPSAAISVATIGGDLTITFASLAVLNTFNPLPFWDTSTSPATYVTCNGWTLTTYTGCSSNPAANAYLVSGAMSDAGISTLGGFIKVERNNADGSGWTDITIEMLNYGFGDLNDGGTPCPVNPTPDAIIRLQRLRDNQAGGGGCNYNTDATGAKDPTNWWPNVLYDAREGLLRDWDYPNPGGALPPTAGSNASDPRYLTLGGIMYYVNIDAGNLARWFKHNTAPYNVAGSTGNLSLVNGTGYSVYFSDRRNNRNAASQETGEYGWEDFVNPAAANGVPNNTADNGEDVNENGAQELYGGVPNYAGVYNSVPPCTLPQTCATVYTAPTGITILSTANANPQAVISSIAQQNRPILFRRALMLSNGAGIGANPVVADRLTGLTIISENPVYVKGNWNAETPAGTGFGGVNAASAVIADSVTLLSPTWADSTSFSSPYNRANRAAGTSGWYRLAIVGGKGKSFTLPTVGLGIAADFGTDGGAHNFLRFLQNWGGLTVNYLGSLATLYYNRQAVGTYKCCTTVYGAPARAFSFDVNFLNPALLPPLTPMFRDINVIGFSQDLRPGK